MSAGSKLLYGEITALCNEKGFCWASNEYFASLYESSTKTVTRWVNSLLENKYIICNYRQNGTKKERCISISNSLDKNVFDRQKCIEQWTKVSKTVDKNVPYNNTYNNTINNIGENPKREVFIPPTIVEIQSYCIERNNQVNAQMFLDFYTSKGWMVGKNKMKDWQAAVRTWENKDKTDKPKDAMSVYGRL